MRPSCASWDFKRSAMLRLNDCAYSFFFPFFSFQIAEVAEGTRDGNKYRYLLKSLNSGLGLYL